MCGRRSGAAEALDLVLIIAARNLWGVAIGDTSVWIIYPAMFLYFVVMEAHSGQTIGKRITHLRVVDSTGRPPSIAQSLIRNFVRPFEAFGLLGIAVVAFGDKGQRIGDLLAGTFVVDNNELRSLASTESLLKANELPGSRQVIPLDPAALQFAKEQIYAAYNPAETGLCIAVDDSLPQGLAVQFDLVDTSDDRWHYTVDGVTVSVPRAIADRCNGLKVVVQDGRLGVARAT